MEHHPDQLKQLAALAHDFWRARLVSEGWQHGKRYDAAARRHDALMPFESLAPQDQQEAVECLLGVDIPDLLAKTIQYDRGPERAFSLAEMKPGVRVAWAAHVIIEDPDLAKARSGTIVDWRIDPQSEQLSRFRVQWDTGCVTEHEPLIRDLRRLD